MSDDETPVILPLDIDLDAVRASLGVNQVPQEEATEEPKVVPISRRRPLKRGRGRPKLCPHRKRIGFNECSICEPNIESEDTDSDEESPAVSGDVVTKVKDMIPPAPLTKRDEREVATRLIKILTGSTGMAAIYAPYVQMTDDEAKDIAEPLAAYLCRNADTIPVARQVLENYDLAAIVLGTMGYVVRVYRDRQDYVAEQRTNQRPTLSSIPSSPSGSNGRQSDEGTGAQIGNQVSTGSSGF